MKQIFKKVSSLCTVLLMMAVLTLTGVSSVWAADEVDDTVKQTLVTTAEGLTDTIIALSDEDIENYTKSSDEFTVGAMTAWAGSKDEVGALKERTGETEVKASDDGYTVTVPVSFEKADANFVYIFDASTGAPTSLTVDVQYSMAETLRRAVMNTIMGIAIVFIVLIFLSFLIYLFRFIPNPEAKKKAQAAAPAPAPVAAPVEVAEAPGFVVNRILIPMINEASFILQEGIASAEDIDTAMKYGANHPMGPLALGDLIGLDVCLAIMDVLYKETGDTKYRASNILRKYVRAGWLGRKSGRGFFNYQG